MYMDRKIVQSTKWSGITELLAKIMTPLINIILARLLTPEVFGVVATFTMVVTFAEVFTDAGFQKYIIQHEFINDQEKEQVTNIAFWTNFVFSCVAWVVIFIFRNQIAILVGSAGYGMQISIMSLNIPMVALSSIQMALYRRDFRFKQIMPARVAAGITPLVITVPLAAIFRNSWAMVWGALAKEIVLVIILTVRSTWKPRLYYSFAKLKEMISFSVLIMADSFVIWCTGYAGTFIVSHSLDDYYTGIYKIGNTTISTYMNLVYMIVAPVLFSALSRIQNDRDGSNKVYYSFQYYSALIVIPLGFGVFMFRDFVTRVLLGSQWEETSLLLGCTALSMAFAIITAQYNSDYFRAQGRPIVSLIVQTAYALIMVIVLLIVAEMPFKVISIAQGVVKLIYTIISTFALCTMFKVSILRIFKNMMYPLVGSLVMSFVAWFMLKVSNGILWSLFSVIVCFLTYLLVLLAIPVTRKEILNFKVLDKFKRLIVK